jgi:uncharacterized protein (DUF1800 family)
MNAARYTLALLASLSLAGCATPKPVLELAGKGAGTVGLAEASLRNYLAATEAQLTARTELLRADSESVTREALRRELVHAYEAAAGVPRSEASAELIRTMAAKRKEVREKQAQQFAKIDAEHTFDSAAMAQVPTEKLAAAKKSFTVLSEELSSSEWLALIGGYAKVIAEGVDQLHSSSDQTGNNPGN